MKETLQKVCDEFDLGALKSFEQIEEGVLNVNYKIHADAGCFFVKTIRGRKQDSLETIFKIEKYMAENGINAVTMLLNKNRDYFSKIGDDIFCVYPFIESDRSHTYAEQDYFRMGETLAKIHLVTKDSLPDFEMAPIKNPKRQEIILTLNNFKQKITGKEILNEIDEKFLKSINAKISALENSDENYDFSIHQPHLLHGDYHAGNLLIDAHSREITGICDWEKSEIGSRAYEIARSLLFVFDFSKEENLKLIKFFMDGYNSKYPISQKELIEGFAFRLNRQIKSKWIETMYYENNDSRGNHFIDYEIFLTDFYSTDWKNKIEKYL